MTIFENYSKQRHIKYFTNTFRVFLGIFLEFSFQIFYNFLSENCFWNLFQNFFLPFQHQRISDSFLILEISYSVIGDGQTRTDSKNSVFFSRVPFKSSSNSENTTSGVVFTVSCGCLQIPPACLQRCTLDLTSSQNSESCF